MCFDLFFALFVSDISLSFYGLLLQCFRFGLVLASRAIRAAHCLTSIQVSC